MLSSTFIVLNIEPVDKVQKLNGFKSKLHSQNKYEAIKLFECLPAARTEKCTENFSESAPWKE
jgi:hypothetical protein